MATKYESNRRCVVNFNATRAWRDAAHARAAFMGRTLTEHIKTLVDDEQEAAVWRSIANDLYRSVCEINEPTRLAKEAMIRYERQRDGRV